MSLLDLIAGARPNFMKIAPIIDALKTAQARGSRLSYRLIHTGQHYDRAMSQAFFEELGIPEPDVNLGAGSGSQAEQTAAIMIGYEKVLQEKQSNLCVVVGDVTSTMACAIVARKAGVPVAHVEAGIRSGDWTMPEEINRVVTDSITNWFFTTSTVANDNLRKAGVSEGRITEGALLNLAALPKREAAQVLKKIARLRNGLIGDVKKLHQNDYGFRLRAGRYRVLFDLDGDKIVIQKVGD